jgi:type IV pilus assembly protein PilB
MVPEEMMKEYQILLLSHEEGRLNVATMDPLDLASLDHMLQEFTNSDVQFEDRGEGDGEIHAESAPIIRLVQLIITEAVRMRASVIHVEPLASKLRVRYRVDGVCMERDPPPKRLQGAITTRIKLLAGIQIEEKRLPQDGRLELNVGGRPVDLRVSLLPTMFGESVVMRVLDRSQVGPDITKLGLRDDGQQVVDELIHLPNGICIVTGPTDSGKTTALYSAL